MVKIMKRKANIHRGWGNCHYPGGVQNILVVGAGTIGLQMAMKFALSGCCVNIYDLDHDVLSRAYERLQNYGDLMIEGGLLAVRGVSEGISRINLFDSLALAAREVDMVSESVTENPRIKKDLFMLLSEVCSPTVILTTNTSTFTPSMFLGAIRYPKMFAAFHCYPPLWSTRIVDIMPHYMTSPEVVRRLMAVAERIGMIPLILSKETSGYVFNSMLHALLKQALSLRIANVASIPDIDRAWMGVTGMTMGPFGIMDMIGIDTVFQVLDYWALRKNDDTLRACALYLKYEYLDKGLCGVKTKSGFYSYPNAEFMGPKFIEGVRNDGPEGENVDGEL